MLYVVYFVKDTRGTHFSFILTTHNDFFGGCGLAHTVDPRDKVHHESHVWAGTTMEWKVV